MRPFSLSEKIEKGLIDLDDDETRQALYRDSKYLPQAGGHQLMSQSGDGSVVYKPTNQTEIDFFERASHDPTLRAVLPFLPKYHGVIPRWKDRSGGWAWTATSTSTSSITCSPQDKAMAMDVSAKPNKSAPSKSDELDQQIILENLYSDFIDPNIIDFKMGDTLADPDSEAGVKQRRKSRTKPLKSTLAPVRLAGCELRTHETDHTGKIRSKLRTKLGKKDRPDFSSDGQGGGYSVDDTLRMIFPSPIAAGSMQSAKSRLGRTSIQSQSCRSQARKRKSCHTEVNETPLHPSTTGCGVTTAMAAMPQGARDIGKIYSRQWKRTLQEYDRTISILQNTFEQSEAMRQAFRETEWRFPGSSVCVGFGPLASNIDDLVDTGTVTPNKRHAHHSQRTQISTRETTSTDVGLHPSISVGTNGWGVRASFIDMAYAFPAPGQGGDPGLEKAFDKWSTALSKRIGTMEEERAALREMTASLCRLHSYLGLGCGGRPSRRTRVVWKNGMKAEPKRSRIRACMR